MVVRTRCTRCGMIYDLAESMAGKHVRCRACHQPFHVDPLPDEPTTDFRAGTPPVVVRNESLVDVRPQPTPRVRSRFPRGFLKLLALVVPAYLGAIFTVALITGEEELDPPKPTGKTTTARFEPGEAPPAPQDVRPKVTGKGTGAVSGRVTYGGTPPRPELQLIKADDTNADYCKKNDPYNTLWVVDVATRGVKGVVVWVRAPKGSYFDLNDAQKGQQKKEVVVDQPKCNFEPRIAAYFPSYYDGGNKKQTPTGNKLTIANHADFTHNTAFEFSEKLAGNQIPNQILNPKNKIDAAIKVSQDSAMGTEQLVTLSCGVHPWMSGKVAAFDHPFFAVTNEKGEFKIENVPAGVELELVYWHESMGPTSLKSGKANKLSVKAGENKQEDFKIKK